MNTNDWETGDYQKFMKVADRTYDDSFIKAQQKPDKASEKAVSYLLDLAKGRVWTDQISQLPPVWQEQFAAILANPGGTYAKTDVSKFIDLLKTCDKSYGGTTRAIPGSAAASNPPTEDGIYSKHGKFFKVYWNREFTRLLAKEIVLIQEAKDIYDEEEHNVIEHTPAVSELVYRGQAYRFVTADDKYNPTLEEALAFGPKYGRCSQCGRNLNDELSVQLGIGPVCGDRDFGEDFKVMKKMAKAKLNRIKANTTGHDPETVTMTPDAMRAELANIDEELNA